MNSCQNVFLCAGVADRVIRLLPLSPIYELLNASLSHGVERPMYVFL